MGGSAGGGGGGVINIDRTTKQSVRVQEPCESRGGRPGLPVLMSLMVSVHVKQQ